MLSFKKTDLGSVKQTFLVLLFAGIFTLISAMTHAAPVDLSGWIENGFKGNNGAGNWVVQSGNDSVLQTINGDPTIFFKAGSNAQGTRLSGSIKVETTGDDDYVGFVLGYQDGEMNSTSADFWLIDWKQLNQGVADQGLALSHVTGDIQNGPSADFSFWNHASTVNEVQRANNLGSIGWADNTEYLFDLIFTSTWIQVKVNGVVELDYTGTFSDGAFGFYNYSQNPVRYAGITADVAPPSPGAVPEPATMLLFGIGLLGLTGVNRRKR